MVHEEKLKKQIHVTYNYMMIYLIQVTSIKYYSPRLNEYDYTFNYLTANRTNRKIYNYKLRKDLSYIFYSITNGIPIIVKNKRTDKSETIILKESELYFKIKNNGKFYRRKISRELWRTN